MTHFFFFGTLLDRDLLSRVVERSVPESIYTPARLSGYRIVRLKEEVYPMLTADSEGVVTGAVVDSFSDADLKRILFYESVEYMPTKITVETGEGEAIDTRAFAGSTRAVPGARPWSFTDWQREEKAAALLEARVWMAFYGLCDIETADRIWDDWRDAGKPLAGLEFAIPDLIGSVSLR